MKNFLLSALALASLLGSADAQEKVKVHSGNESYVTTIDYVTFDVAASDEVVSVPDLKSQNANLASQVATLTTANTQLEGEKQELSSQVTTLTSKNNKLEAKLARIQVQFDVTGVVGHDFVDLGLPSGTLWATCNVGAAEPEDMGDYFAWGEVTPHESGSYSWTNYKWCQRSHTSITKYCDKVGFGCPIDNRSVLDDDDDAAIQNWGGKWRMPTQKQIYELMDGCYWVWTDTYNGKSINGFIVYKAKDYVDKGKKVFLGETPSADYDVETDAHIFLPAAGYRMSDAVSAGSAGCYWSRDLSKISITSSYRLSMYESSSVMTDDFGRFYGLTVRPVCPAPK